MLIFKVGIISQGPSSRSCKASSPPTFSLRHVVHTAGHILAIGHHLIRHKILNFQILKSSIPPLSKIIQLVMKRRRTGSPSENTPPSPLSLLVLLLFPFFLVFISSMALRKTLAHRLFNMTKISSGAPIFANPTTSTFNMMKSGFLRQWLQKRGIFNLAVPLECLSLPIGDQLIERLREMNDDRLRLSG